MTKEEYRKALEILGLSIVGAASHLGVSRRQAQRYASRRGTAVPERTAKLVRWMVAAKQRAASERAALDATVP